MIAIQRGKTNPNRFIIMSGDIDSRVRDSIDFISLSPGANDNASGVAMLLYLSKYFSENKPKYSIAFMAFGAEEVGILGSKYYVENPLFPLKDIRFVVNCDIMGTGDHGVTVVNGTVHKKEFKKLAVLNLENKYVEKVKAAEEAFKKLTEGAEVTESGLAYIITEKGTGEQAVAGMSVTVHYKGMLTDGTVFDSSFSRNEPIEFPLGEGRVIPGWDEGLLLLKKGSKAKLIIPSPLGYGESGAGAMIPANSILVFDVEVTDSKK